MPLRAEKRNNGIAEGVEIHEGAYFLTVGGNFKYAGSFGCYGIVDPSQVNQAKDKEPIPSNAELIRFEDAIKTANDMQIEECGVPSRTEVEIKPRQYNKTKIVEKK